ncbi:ribosome-binding protein 1 isoform X1 [Alligator mississippiensis]|uniref:ribosome-binding protein 1 isoform X1 n=1 Tax=Alligator mississippiensis TaxID=8496 RepID=UPI0003D0F0E2|nr:ribosome-binding protein 1 isoform X1 [Alligator mississippiensis]XP_014449274.1 ribosome-binding protein 1 isoform X1 [Alligator mississippiensis]XP_019346588.1 ribosome-binding protein 1 isoform X1 [Alligator mississippiensis]
MDLYDPQTLGFMVFGGFMVISAIGIFLVSTFSMKETSYEEALAKQRKELEKSQQHKVEKKKKEKPVEKKVKTKKKEEKPNGKIPEQEPGQEVTDASKEVAPEPAPVSELTVLESPIVVVSAAPQEKEKPVPSPKEKKKKEKKVPKVEPVPSSVVASPPSPVLQASPLKKIAQVVEVECRPLGQQSGPRANSAVKKADPLVSQEELRPDGAAKKATSKKKGEAVPTDADGPLYLPYKTLVSTISSMIFSEGEAQQLIEILSERAGVVQDTWHTATQKGDPVTVLKRQLEEKEKQLSAEQEDASAAKNKLRELNKELAAEKAKTVSVETKLKEQLLAREQEVAAIQARMQASYQDHVNETQQLQGKIRSLQEQLENGPNTQLARLQQENSILRDALNQATSQTESKQNAELAKLRQECSKLTKELSEKSETLQQEEQQKKSLEVKAAAFEKQIDQLQTSQKETETVLQKRLDEVSEELRKTQTSYKSLLTDTEKTKEQQQSLTELQAKLLSSEMETKSKSEELDGLKTKLLEASAENMQLTERIKSIEALLEAGQTRETEKDKGLQEANQAEVSQLQLRLQEKSDQVALLEKEAMELKEIAEQQKTKNNDLREKNWKAMEALATAEKACEEKVLAAAKAKEESEQQLGAVQALTQQTLLSAFPEVTVSSQQTYNEWLREFKEKTLEMLKQQMAKTESVDSALKLQEAEEAQSTLQVQCEQYRTTLAETEGMLQALQKSVEKEEQVWKAKLTVSEEELQKSRVQVQSLEEAVEKLRVELQNTDQVKEYTSLLEAQLKNHLETANSERQNYTKEVEILRQLLSESQDQLEAAKTEAQKQSKELALVRQQLSEMKNHVQDGEVVGLQADQNEHKPLELKTQLEQTEANLDSEQVLRQKLALELEEAQKAVCCLQVELEKLRSSENVASSGMEEAQQLKERLEKEKKLTKDLGRAATKLQELLKITQEQLGKERETVKKLKEQLQETGEDNDGSKEGTSV